jgi:nitroreductase/ferredoxin
MAWEDVKSILRPENVHMGVMEVDAEFCTGCGLCIENCPFGCWEMGENDVPRLKEEYACFSCYNCAVACPVEAVSIVEPYHVDDGFWATEPHPLPAKLPLKPKDADGNPDEWNAIERAVLERRSVRNFKDTPVPDTLIRRVLEAGRFAPSAGNCQPWRFYVITDRALIKTMDEAVIAGTTTTYNMYRDDEQVKNMEAMVQDSPSMADPRLMIGGMGAIAKRFLPPSLNAPCVILLAADSRAIGGPQTSIGICGQNMTLVANSLGIKSCWVGFLAGAANSPLVADKVGLASPWRVITTLVLGYPRFKQEGIVPREYRPVTWVREGAEGIEIEE